jgi:hypothetical protein
MSSPKASYFLTESFHDSEQSVILMKAAVICITLLLCTPVQGAEKTPNHRLALLSRVTCPAVREAVKLYGEAAAEQWARGHGVSETRIEQARQCLK